MHSILGKALLAGALALAAVGVMAFFVSVLNRSWTEAAIFAGGTLPPLAFLWRHRMPRAGGAR
ncbi:MAG TPA: hypothetical protein ENO23_01060 [Alphaproteobacteria bacterium]|nr:hypothetical protein [Alphaproteobacteria bacterium]